MTKRYAPGPRIPLPHQTWPQVGARWPAYNLASDQANGLLAWWPTLAGNTVHTLRDFIGSYHAPLQSGAVITYDHELGHVLNATAGGAVVPEGNDLDPPEGCLSLSVWAYYSSSTASSPVLQKRDVWGANTQRWNFNFHFTAVQWVSTDATVSFGNGTAIVGSWHLYTMTDDGTNSRLYRDAVLKDTDNSLTFDNDAASQMCIGIATQTSTHFPGLLADPRIYNRVLSAAEVSHIYERATRWELHDIPRHVWAMRRVEAPAAATVPPLYYHYRHH